MIDTDTQAIRLRTHQKAVQDEAVETCCFCGKALGKFDGRCADDHLHKGYEDQICCPICDRTIVAVGRILARYAQTKDMQHIDMAIETLKDFVEIERARQRPSLTDAPTEQA